MDIKIYTEGSKLITEVEEATVDLSEVYVGTVELVKGYGIKVNSTNACPCSNLVLKDFTFSFWAKFLSKTMTMFLRDGDNRIMQSVVWSDANGYGYIGFRCDYNYPSHSFLVPELNTPYHIAITRKDGKVNVFVNGKKTTTFTFSSDWNVAYLFWQYNYNGMAVNNLQLTDQILYTNDFTPSYSMTSSVIYIRSDEVWGYK